MSELEDYLQRAKKFCAYRERCQKEMRLKLKKMGASSIIAEQVITELIVSGFVNEQRFALSFCSGKFRHNSWGKVRIIQELQKREISSKCIEVAINEIVEEEYLSELKRLITLKLKERNKEGIIKKNRTAKYCIRKGYESTLVWTEINKQIC